MHAGREFMERFWYHVKNLVNTHIINKENPHKVTKEQIGLGNVPNVSTNDQTPTFTVVNEDTELTSGEKLSTLLGKIARTVLSVISLKEEVSRLNGNKISGVPMVTENIIEAADSILVGRICFFFLSGSTHVSLSPLPDNYKYGTAIVLNRNAESRKIILFPENGIYQPVSKSSSSANGEWGEWIYFDGTKV